MKTITMQDETFIQLKEQIEKLEKKAVNIETPFEVGKSYFIRTVTYHLVGKLDKIVGNMMVLSEASWVADSGRFMNAIKDGTLDEVEPVGIVYVNINAITDMFPWEHSLPTEQK